MTHKRSHKGMARRQQRQAVRLKTYTLRQAAEKIIRDNSFFEREAAELINLASPDTKLNALPIATESSESVTTLNSVFNEITKGEVLQDSRGRGSWIGSHYGGTVFGQK